MRIRAKGAPMKKNDGANDNERGRRLTRRAVLKATLALSVMAKAFEHGSDIGESLSTAFLIKQKEGDQQALLQAWYEEWRKLGERIEKIGDECLAKGHKISARDAYLRASEYYRSADFYLHGNPKNPAIFQLWDIMDSCFENARKLSIPSFESIQISYEGTKLP